MGSSILHTFIALCEGFLGICPHFDLWWHFFTVTLLKKREKRQELNMPMGCTDIQLYNNRVNEYLLMHLSTSNKGWHSHWFYIKNDAAAPLPEFTERLIEEVSESWRRWGVPEKDKKRIQDHLTAIRILKEGGQEGVGDHQLLPYEESGTADEARASPTHDGAQGII